MSSSESRLRDYLDEHLPLAIAEQLRARGIDALAAGDAGRAGRGVSDEEQLAFASAEGRTLVTSDRDFIALSVTCTPHAGVALLQNRLGIGQAIEYLEILAEVVRPEEMRDQVRFCDW